MMHYSNATLDGVQNGIGGYVKSKGEYIRKADGKTLFTSVAALEALLHVSDYDYHDISFVFVIHDQVAGKVKINLNECTKVDGYWKCTRPEENSGRNYLHIYNIYEKEIPVVDSIGYITNKFTGTHNEDDQGYEYSKQRKLKEIIEDALNSMAQYRDYDIRVFKKHRGFEVDVHKSLFKCHIWNNAKLINYNTAIKKRREANENEYIRCLPFSKDQDKFGSFYVFYTIDKSNYTADVQRLVDRFHSVFIAFLSDLDRDTEIKYRGIEFAGEVIFNKIEEEVPVNENNDSKNGKDNFFVNADGSIRMKYDPSFNTFFLFSPSILEKKRNIPIDKIVIQKGGQISFVDNGSKYIIDDGYRNRLINCGYMYIDANDDEYLFKEALIKAFSKEELYNAYNVSSFKSTSNSVTVIMNSPIGYKITIDFVSLNKLIDSNLRRKYERLPMYPTTRVEKNSSIYWKIYAEKEEDMKPMKSNTELSILSNSIIDKLISDVNDYYITKLLPSEYKNKKVSIIKNLLRKTIIRWEEDL